ncbi:MAG: M6 family metalloprotease domain-containing protein [Bacteroidales bacterium]|nr:M6 family metalloprotease domain-containing protein [Bacteroidales bacterium]
MRKPATLILAALLLLSLEAAAVRVRHSELTAVQPDGTVLSLLSRGDENFHYLTTSDGRLVKRGPDGAFYYAYFDNDGNIRPSAYQAGRQAPAAVLAAASSFPTAIIDARIASMTARREISFPGEKNLMKRMLSAHPFAEGSTPLTKHVLIILAEFKDTPHSYDKSRFDDMVGGESNGASLTCYFNDQFLGKFEFAFDVVDWVPLPQNRAFYGENNARGNDKNAVQMVIDACTAADSSVDFSKYDDDGDGKADNVFIWFSGRDESDDEASNADCIWSHHYKLSYVGKSFDLDGVTIDSYACTSEQMRLAGSNDYTMASIGTFCHEFSHTFGLPDLYDTDYKDSEGTGKGLWHSLGLMDAGNQNNDGYTPPWYNAIDRHELGLGECIPLTVGTHTLEPIHKNGRYYIMNTPNEGEYYLFECRSSEKWDAYCGGTGLVIYHIDQSQNMVRNTTAAERWQKNTVNCVPWHQCADVVPATPNASVVSQVFWPNSIYRAYTPQGIPSFKFWDNTPSSLAIIDIKKSGGSVEFTVTDDFSPVPSVASASASVFQDAAIVSITSSSTTFEGEVVVECYKSGTTEPYTVRVSPYSPGKYAALIEGLTPKTAYRTKIYFEDNGVSGNICESLSFTTKTYYRDGSGSLPFIYFNGAERDENGRFAAGSKIPLRIYNLPETVKAEWSFDGKPISAGGDCHYEITRSGLLKVIATLRDGSREIITKQINVQ